MKTIIPIAIAVLSLIGLMIYEPHATVQNTDIVTAHPMAVTAPEGRVVHVEAVEATIAEEIVETPLDVMPEDDTVYEEDEADYSDNSYEEASVSEEEILRVFTASETESLEEEIIEEETSESYSLGVYRITYYCGCEICCGQWSGSPTASGAYPTEGWTIACGEDIPFGTLIEIDGHVYCCEDRGVPSGCIDIYVEDHDVADAGGLYYTDVYLVG